MSYTEIAMNVTVNAKVYSKGHPPAAWHLPTWLYRMFVWGKTQIGSVNQTLTLPIAAGVPIPGTPFIATAEQSKNDPNAYTLSLLFNGVPIKTQDVKIGGKTAINWSASGFTIEGTVTIN